MSDTTPTTAITEPPTTASARALTGLLSEHRDLLTRLAEQPGLLAIAADPWSGTSALLAMTLEDLDYPALLVDARACASAGELAARVADAAVTSLAPETRAWWAHRAPMSDVAGLRLARALHSKGLDIDRLRDTSGPGSRLLSDALRMALELGAGPTLVALDHLDRLLDDLDAPAALELLDVIRAARQALPRLQLLLVGRPDGPLERALRDATHPLYRAGERLEIRRPDPRRFVDDLAVVRAWTAVPVDLLGSAAELAVGVPFLTWQIVDVAPVRGDGRERALEGWRRVRALTDAQTGQSFDLLRRAHPLAQTVVAAISRDGRPYRVDANNKSVKDALARLRELGVAWQPKPRTWALASPLLASWVQDRTRGAQPKRNIHTIKLDDGWGNAYEGDQQILDHTHTKADAVRAGRDRARRHGVQHVIHTTRGQAAERTT